MSGTVNGHNHHAPEPEQVIQNLQMLCNLLVKAVRMAESALVQIEDQAAQNKGAVQPNGLIMPMRECIQKTAETNSAELRKLLDHIETHAKPN